MTALTRRIALIGGMFAASCATRPQGTAMQTFTYGVAPTETGEIGLQLDFYRPAARTPAPVVLIVHGGGFIDGARDLAENQEHARSLAASGFAAASITYRLHQQRPVVSAAGQQYAAFVARCPEPMITQMRGRIGEEWTKAVAACAEDVLRAAAWLRVNARGLSIDSSKLALMGMSAGAVTSTSLAYLGSHFGFEDVGARAVICIRGAILENNGLPVLSGRVPLLVAHGRDDPIISLERARRSVARAREVGIPVVFHPISGFAHDLGGARLLETMLEDRETVEQHLNVFLSAAFDRSPQSSMCISRGGLC